MQVKIAFFASDGSCAVARAYVQVANACADCPVDGPGLFRVPASLPAGARLYLVGLKFGARPARFVAGLRCQSAGVDKTAFAGAVVAPGFRNLGVMKDLVQFAARCERRAAPKSVLVAVVRVFADGTLNLPSLGAFLGAGFRLNRFVQHDLRHDDADRHLAPTARAGKITCLELLAPSPATKRGQS